MSELFTVFADLSISKAQVERVLLFAQSAVKLWQVLPNVRLVVPLEGTGLDECKSKRVGVRNIY